MLVTLTETILRRLVLLFLAPLVSKAFAAQVRPRVGEPSPGMSYECVDPFFGLQCPTGETFDPFGTAGNPEGRLVCRDPSFFKLCYYDSGDGTNYPDDPTATCSASTSQDLGTYCDEGSGLRYVCRNPMPGMNRGSIVCSNPMRKRSNGVSRDPEWIRKRQASVKYRVGL